MTPEQYILKLNELKKSIMVDRCFFGWVEWIDEAINLARKGRMVDAANKMLAASGGMGSLNDVILGNEVDQNGFMVTENQINLTFRKCWSDVYDAAESVKLLYYHDKKSTHGA